MSSNRRAFSFYIAFEEQKESQIWFVIDWKTEQNQYQEWIL